MTAALRDADPEMRHEGGECERQRQDHRQPDHEDGRLERDQERQSEDGGPWTARSRDIPGEARIAASPLFGHLARSVWDVQAPGP
ncbi:hypothetical protein [Microvirga vignae]|uniref:hypothetical protein n=1 Tax=Microvirga vignae TaxID=1225564 RepID=UPI001237488B|nr:hypothetical protein [Microvirga vignae]